MKLPITVTVWPSIVQPIGTVARSRGSARAKLLVLSRPATSQVASFGAGALVGALGEVQFEMLSFHSVGVTADCGISYASTYEALPLNDQVPASAPKSVLNVMPPSMPCVITDCWLTKST